MTTLKLENEELNGKLVWILLLTYVVYAFHEIIWLVLFAFDTDDEDFRIFGCVTVVVESLCDIMLLFILFLISKDVPQ